MSTCSCASGDGGTTGCLDGIIYESCGVPECPGLCQDAGDCDCDCHDDEQDPTSPAVTGGIPDSRAETHPAR